MAEAAELSKFCPPAAKRSRQASLDIFFQILQISAATLASGYFYTSQHELSLAWLKLDITECSTRQLFIQAHYQYLC